MERKREREKERERDPRVKYDHIKVTEEDAAEENRTTPRKDLYWTKKKHPK